mmetsp:Transcript_43844/g.103674  ORF Transcript_43844/g.103674 Transcript_43844/m.103674 type:complete len:722 (+) Transcript_43844:65-2230(+)
MAGFCPGLLDACFPTAASPSTEEVSTLDEAVADSLSKPEAETAADAAVDHRESLTAVGSGPGSASASTAVPEGSASAARTAGAAKPLTPMRKALWALQRKYPYLARPEHDLHLYIQNCESALQEEDEDKAKDILGRLEQEIEQEESTLEAAFSLFKPPSASYLTSKELKAMLEYLGFPADEKSVAQVLTAAGKDGKMSLSDFQAYVGRMGGSIKLFEVRRKQLQHSGATTDMDPAELRLKLLAAGIQDASQAYWRLVVPPSELREASRLVDCQQHALRHIRSLAKSNHEAALPLLQRRFSSLGLTDEKLWLALAWIREQAPILVHVNLTKLMNFFEKDTHYRNQFETSSSGGLLKPQVREKWERDLFGGTYDGAKGFDRCKYGVLNPMNDYRGVVRCSQYGDSYIVLKDVRLRCTFSPEDSANLKADRLAVLDYYGHVLQEYTDAELRETVQVATSADKALLGDSSKIGAMKYKETQIHGEIAFSRHVERLVAHQRHRGGEDEARINAICTKHGWKFSWMDEEQERMKREEKQKLGEDAWKERLQAIMEKGVPDAKDVPEGFCRTGCGRQVAPGLTAKGKPFKTCCRGCVMGFGHDLHCGNIDPSMVGPGKCRNGCGRPVNPGLTPAGRKFDTCCRDCIRGFHSATCGQTAAVCPTVPAVAGGGDDEPGRLTSAPSASRMCKKGCGRPVAPPQGARKFDTCCRGCGLGKGHDATCKPALEA